MKIINGYIWIFVLGLLFMLPNFIESSWQKVACSSTEVNCGSLSNNYNEPYCITNKWGENYVNHVDSCVRTPLTNSLSDAWFWNGSVDLWDIVKKYCLSLYWGSNAWRIYFAKPSVQTQERDWQQTFDSHQSLFLYAFCSSFTQLWNNHPFIDNDNALVKDAFVWDFVKLLKLQQTSRSEDLCSLDDNPSLSECDIEIYATKIYSAIMTDLYKIKYAQVLNVDKSQDFASNWQRKIEDFMTWYHLSEEEYEKLKNKYPKTISILKSDQMYYSNVLDKVLIINNSLLSQKAKESGCPTAWNMSWIDFVACALHSSQWDWFALTPSFVTLIYNEILHYRQFMLYYHKWLEGKEKSADFGWYSDEVIEATKLVQHDFEDFNMTYPLHIWMLMYIEKIERYRNYSLSKVITLFYSLSEKLKNVQKPSS